MDILISAIQLFVITDPLGNLPIFHSMTKGKKTDDRRKIYLEAAVFGFSILLIFALLGNYILRLFNIGLADFRIAGGLLLLIMAMVILFRGSWILSKGDDKIVGAVPLGCPILAGPGAITTSMVLLGTYGYETTILAVILTFLISFIVLYYGEKIFKILGENGSEIIARLMAIFLAAIGVHHILMGISHIFNLPIVK